MATTAKKRKSRRHSVLLCFPPCVDTRAASWLVHLAMSAFSLWQHLGFRRLYLSSASFTLGTQIYQLALPLIFYELTHSAAVMTGVRAVELLPNLLLAMFIGVWVDRIDRGRWAR